ncbi:Dyp-type peroxidase [Glycomyces sp. NPDC046736]|uniref:Dyp-type peroxidase n=1 Tax=Glycomyces sp. NPDC046736 TaxID=3155615 RepID=UPI0033FD1406
MHTPQIVIEQPTEAALILVLTARPGREPEIRDFLADLDGIRRGVGFRIPADRLSCVVGIGTHLWDRLFTGPRPAQLREFTALEGPRHRAPSTEGDLVLHIRARAPGPCFELGKTIVEALGSACAIVDETHGFRYFDERDLLGFVDGTENPEGPDAVQAAIIDGQDPAFAGGAYVVVQKYLHDLKAWEGLPESEQERVIGRTKLADRELSDAAKPADSHIALNDLEPHPDGTPRKIMRFNMPFGSLESASFGTYFVGYTADLDVIDEMLRNMFLGKPHGNVDRILDFSTATTGTVFFCPATTFLQNLPPAPA